jgi:hypothetical protein
LIDSKDDDRKALTISDAAFVGDRLIEQEAGGELPYYDNYHWQELPHAAQIAAKMLGYNNKIWDKEKLPDILRGLKWSDLSLTQRAAALEIGWDRQARLGWHQRRWVRRHSWRNTSKPYLDRSGRRTENGVYGIVLWLS